MPRGAPDYSNVTAVNPLHRLDDHAELAARLGSPNTHDRAGFIVFIESFNFGLGAWESSGAGTGNNVLLVNSPFRTGPFACKLVAGDNGTGSAKLFRKFPYPKLNRYGLEFSVRLGASTGDFLWTLAYHDGTNEHNYTMKYMVTEQEVWIKGATGDYSVLVTDLPLQFLYSPFQTIKMVVDLENDLFVRLIVNETTYDISTYPAYIFAIADSPNVRVDLQQRVVVGGNPSSHVDDIILTQGEPPNP